MFDRLVAFPSLLTHPNLTVEVLLLSEDHIRAVRPVTAGSRTLDPGERHLREVLERIELRDAHDVRRMLPPLPREPFSTRELATVLECSMLLAQRTVYCLRAVEIIEASGKRGRTPLHRYVPSRR
ncbi:MAG: hypothetical protein ACLP8S_17570 [Solirubrobacteraceae bacterium]